MSIPAFKSAPSHPQSTHGDHPCRVSTVALVRPHLQAAVHSPTPSHMTVPSPKPGLTSLTQVGKTNATAPDTTLGTFNPASTIPHASLIRVADSGVQDSAQRGAPFVKILFKGKARVLVFGPFLSKRPIGAGAALFEHSVAEYR